MTVKTSETEKNRVFVVVRDDDLADLLLIGVYPCLESAKQGYLEAMEKACDQNLGGSSKTPPSSTFAIFEAPIGVHWGAMYVKCDYEGLWAERAEWLRKEGGRE